MSKTAKKVVLSVEDKIALITIDNPPVNVLDEQVVSQLERQISQLADLDQVRVVVVTGAGEKAFVAGADIRQFLALDRAAGEKLVKQGQQVLNKLSDLPQVVIGAINGVALGGGCELALACDIRVLAENAKIGLPEVGLGVIPGYGGTQRLARLVGIGKALELICSGDPITAEEAHRIGLVERLAKPGSVLPAAIDLANRILDRGPLAVMAAKKAIKQGIEKPFPEGLELEANLFGFLCESLDKNEGAQAFIEKRKPQFLGK